MPILLYRFFDTCNVAFNNLEGPSKLTRPSADICVAVGSVSIDSVFNILLLFVRSLIPTSCDEVEDLMEIPQPAGYLVRRRICYL